MKFSMTCSLQHGLCVVVSGCALALLLAACGDAAAPARVAPGAAPDLAARPRAMARGIVEMPGGLFEVLAPLDGAVETVNVAEGDHVRAGQLLLQLSAVQQRQDLAQAQAELELAQARQQAQAARRPGAAQLADRMAAAARGELVEGQRADEAQQALRELDAALAVAQAETAVARQKVAQVQAQAARLALRAPQDAEVLKLQVQPGTRVALQGGRVLMTLLPARALRVRAELNEAYLAQVAPGQRARVFVDGDGASSAPLPSAHVVRISPVFGASRLDDEAPARGTVRVVDCFLEFDSAPALRIGQAVRVEFHE